MIIPACFTYFQASRDGFQTKSNRIEFDCVQFSWHSIGSIIEFKTKEMFDFVRLLNPIERLVFN